MGMFNDLHKQDLADQEKQAQAKQATKQSSLQSNKQESKEAFKQVSKETRKQGSEKASRLDITAEAYHPATFEFTDDELYALDDLKRDLRRKLDLKTTKERLIRYALHRLVDDYEQAGEASWIVQQLQKK